MAIKQLSLELNDVKAEELPFRFVTVTHQVHKIIANHNNGENQAFWDFNWAKEPGKYHTSTGRRISHQDLNRYQGRWPGLELPVDTFPCASRWSRGRFEPSPRAQDIAQAMRVYAFTRFRRFPFYKPVQGVITGFQRRIEGCIYRDGEAAGLTGPARTLYFYEVVLQPKPHFETQIILATDLDIIYDQENKTFG